MRLLFLSHFIDRGREKLSNLTKIIQWHHGGSGIRILGVLSPAAHPLTRDLPLHRSEQACYGLYSVPLAPLCPFSSVLIHSLVINCTGQVPPAWYFSSWVSWLFLAFYSLVTCILKSTCQVTLKKLVEIWLG